MQGDFFKDVIQWDFPAERFGTTGKLPVFYRDTLSMTAVFTASSRAMRRHLPHGDMHLAELYPGRCLLAFSAFSYGSSDIGPYNEFSIAVLITYGKRSLPGFGVLGQVRRRRLHAYVRHLPVTTEIARWGGVEMYGYPKFVADIAFARDADTLACTLRDGDAPVLTLRGKVLAGAPAPPLRIKTYSVKNGVPLRANVCTNFLACAATTRRDGAVLEIGGDHEIARELAAVGLGAAPVYYQYSPASEVILFAPRNLMDD